MDYNKTLRSLKTVLNFVLMLSIAFLFSCKKDKPTTLSFIESRAEILLDTLTGQYQDNFIVGEMGIDNQENIYIIGFDGLGNSKPVIKFDYENNTAEYFLSDGKQVNGNNIIVRNNILNVYENFFGLRWHNTYDIDGTSLDSNNITGEFYPGMNKAIAVDSKGAHFILSTSGSESEADGRYLDIYKFNGLLSEKVKELTKAEVLKLLPNEPDEFDVAYFDIACDNNDKIYISVDMNSEENEALDGILILNNDLEYVNYLKDDWLLNCPGDIDFDANNNMYVASTSSNEVKVFDTDLKLVATTPIEGNGGLTTPTILKVENNKLFVVDDGIFIYNTIE